MTAKKFKKIECPEDLLCEIAKILKDLKIPYVITGGFAVAVWGRPRFTSDIDIIVELLDKNIEQLSKRLFAIDKDSYLSISAARNALVTKREFNFIHSNTGMKVDFWVRNTDFDKEKIQRAVRKKLKRQIVNFVSPEDLILSKLLWYKKNKSDREIEDIRSVLRFSKVDLNYIQKKATEHDTIDIFKKVNSRQS